MNIPINSVLGYIGLALLVFGVFMVLAGLDVISIQQVTVRKGKKTWILGIVFALLGIWMLLPELRTTPPAVSSPETPEPLPAPPDVSTPALSDISTPAPSSVDLSESPIAFNIPDNGLWDQPSDGSYTVTGTKDTIAWSDIIVEGDLELAFDIVFQGPNGEGDIIIYGNGIGLSDEQLFFGFGPVENKIMAGTPYETRYLDTAWVTDMDVSLKHSIIVRIANGEASLFLNGVRTLSALIPEDVNTSGRIGIYKYHGETGLGDNGATYSNFRLTASSVVGP